jgi:hypothetical protein
VLGAQTPRESKEDQGVKEIFVILRCQAPAVRPQAKVKVIESS